MFISSLSFWRGFAFEHTEFIVEGKKIEPLSEVPLGRASIEYWFFLELILMGVE